MHDRTTGRAHLRALERIASSFLAAGGLAMASSAQGVCFESDPTLTVGSGPNSVALADLNADGRVDIVVAEYGSLSVLLRQADGAFAPAVHYGAGGGAASVAVG